MTGFLHMIIDYRQLTDDNRADFQELVAIYARTFFKWRTKTPGRLAKPATEVFESWWLQHGPLGFRHQDDAMRFKRELLAEVSANAA